MAGAGVQDNLWLLHSKFKACLSYTRHYVKEKILKSSARVEVVTQWVHEALSTTQTEPEMQADAPSAGGRSRKVRRSGSS